MKNYVLLPLTICLLFVFSCKEEECETNRTGEVNITNDSPYPYNIKVDEDAPVLLVPNEELALILKEGQYEISATRADDDGANIPPIDFDTDVVACSMNNVGIDN